MSCNLPNISRRTVYVALSYGFVNDNRKQRLNCVKELLGHGQLSLILIPSPSVIHCQVASLTIAVKTCLSQHLTVHILNS